MGIENLSDNVLLVDLPHNPAMMANELKRVNDIVSTRFDCSVIVDFFKVEIITSSSISNLLILRSLLSEHGRDLVLCNAATITRCIFTVAGIKDIFQFADDKAAAVAALENAPRQQSLH